jgi:hypothetical protein
MAEHTKNWFFVNGNEDETPEARRNGGGADPDTITKLIYPDGTVRESGSAICYCLFATLLQNAKHLVRIYIDPPYHN